MSPKRFYIAVDLRGSVEKQLSESLVPELAPRLREMAGIDGAEITIRLRVQKDMWDMFGDYVRIYPLDPAGCPHSKVATINEGSPPANLQ